MKHFRVDPQMVGWDEWHAIKRARCINVFLVVGLAAGLGLAALIGGTR